MHPTMQCTNNVAPFKTLSLHTAYIFTYYLKKYMQYIQCSMLVFHSELSQCNWPQTGLEKIKPSGKRKTWNIPSVSINLAAWMLADVDACNVALRGKMEERETARTGWRSGTTDSLNRGSWWAATQTIRGEHVIHIEYCCSHSFRIIRLNEST